MTATGPGRWVVSGELTIRGVGWPEIGAGDDLAALLVQTAGLADGDIAVVTSKVVSKSEGRTRSGDRAAHVAAETRRVVARRGETVIAETEHGLVMAAAGVDASNTPAGTVVLLPVDPDASARRLREQVYAAGRRNVGIVITDTLGRVWRTGQVDVAIGCAGVEPTIDLAGVDDGYGNALAMTAPAIADEVASAADLVTGKLTGQPVAVVRGLHRLVLPVGHHGAGARSLVRDSESDLFGLGTRDAVAAAARRDDDEALAHYPALLPAEAGPWDGLRSDHPGVSVAVVQEGTDPRVWSLTVQVVEPSVPGYLEAGGLVERARVLAAGHRTTVTDVSPVPPAAAERMVVVLRCNAP